MYGYIKGIIKDIDCNYVIIDNHDIGYLIYVPNPYYYKLNESYTIYTYNNVKEDEYSLYGFKNKEELNLFLKLISVKGLGPKMALKKFPKIGDKVARQIILDLKGKLNGNQMSLLVHDNNELTDALLALGYKQSDIKKVIVNIDQNLSLEEQIKESLKMLLK